jgi:EpsI family protein
MVQVTGIPVYREGTFFQLPTGNWSVVEGCSGVRYLIASVVLGTLYAYLTYTSYLKRSLFIIASLVVPIIANGFRAYGIVMIAHFSDMKLALGVDHFIYGWVWFGIVMFIMFYIGSFWRDPEEENSSLPVQTASGVDTKKLMKSAVGVVLLTLAWPTMAWVQSHSFVENLSVDIDLSPSAEWRELDESFTDWTPAYQAPAAELRKYYESDGRKVGLYLAVYTKQKQDQELVNSQNVMIEQKHEVWAEKGKGNTSLDLDGENVEVKESILRSYSQGLYINHWYWIDGYNTSNQYLAKLIDARMRLFFDKPTAVGIVVYTELGENKQPARDALEAFLDDMMPAIDTALSDAVKANKVALRDD